MLSQKQIAARKGKLTASRIACLMTGDAAKIMDLYLELIEDPSFTPEDLSGVWPVRLGEATESLNLEWVERSGLVLSRHGEVVEHPIYDWAACTLDAWCDELKAPVEAKHVGGREPLEIIVDRYQPQLQWSMECCNATQCVLSVIMGANAPLIEYIPADQQYAQEMVARGQQFMECVWARRPPVKLELDAVPPPQDWNKVYDLTSNNRWALFAGQWVETKPSADQCKEAEKVLKSLVPKDAKKCFGHGITISRDRAGRLSLRQDLVIDDSTPF